MSVTIFDQNDDAYFRWMGAHPEGLVANSGRTKQSRYFLLHRAGCSHITTTVSLEPGAYTERTYVKACSTDLGELAAWGMAHRSLNGRAFSSLCSSCNPVQDAFLMVWNPKNYHWNDLSEEIAQVEAGQNVTGNWSCGSSRSIPAGSRFFLMKVGDEGRGVIGCGTILSNPFPDEHWDEEKASAGKEAWYVQLSFEVLAETPFISWQEMESDSLRPLRKQLQGSGTRIPHESITVLEGLLHERVEPSSHDFPDEVPPSEARALKEGAKRSVVVNQYERDARARRLCIRHYSSICQACGFDFEQVYGPHGAGFIHVHHLKPISEIGEEYEVDPITDLRPVCPNCHAMLHKGGNTISIAELTAMLRQHTQARVAKKKR